MEPEGFDPGLSERFRANDAGLLEFCHHFSQAFVFCPRNTVPEN